jgi:hypothetical protein
MESATKNTSRWRRYAGIFFILALLIVSLSFYILKFVPDQKNIFHQSAFLELSQIKQALNERNDAYRQAILNYIKVIGTEEAIHNSTPLDKFFFVEKNRDTGHIKIFSGQTIGPSIIQQSPTTNDWEISYPLLLPSGPSGILFSKKLDSVLLTIVSTYKDIFENYLLIWDKPASSPDSAKEAKENPSVHRPPPGEIIFNPGNLALDYEVNTDSLLKKSDGISLLNVRDVTVNGNPYKLFLYPFKLGGERVVLAGIINQSKYKAGYGKIPFSLISFSGVLVLLLLIHLPIIRIYMLGAYERIRDLDIRLIIGSYFIAAFVGFFLFSKLFLNQEQSQESKEHLQILSRKINGSFVGEIRSIILQLKEYDEKFASLVRSQSPLVPAMRSKPKKTQPIRQDSLNLILFGHDSTKLDSIFKPGVYPYGDNFFWIDSTGLWTARWGIKRVLNNAPLINVADRDYFKQFKVNGGLRLPYWLCPTTPFSIQPTLSKLDGEYVISVVIPSVLAKDGGFTLPGTKEKILSPILLGMGAQMHSVIRVVLPPGYYFSITNEEGAILYDSKRGRALLSNISKETDDPADILQSVRYRNERYFDKFTLRGKDVALLTEPIRGFPYELLVYHNVSNNDNFQEHLIGLTGFISGCLILLLILSALLNEWSRRKSSVIQPLEQHFDWLYPASLKKQYYTHLILWMIIFLVLFLLSWAVIEIWFPESEFRLLFISTLLPFFTAIHYYLLREKYANLFIQHKTKPLFRSLFLSHLQVFLLLIILLINCYAFMEGFSWNKFLPLLIIQFVFLAAVWISISSFKKPKDEQKVSVKPIPVSVPPPPNSGQKDPAKPNPYIDLIHRYSIAIILGIFMISIIPASGIFWLIFRQECLLESNSDLLEMGKAIQERRMELNQRADLYKFDKNSQPDLARLKALKYQYGIYTLAEDSVHSGPLSESEYYDRISPEYTDIHQLFFPADSVPLAWTRPTYLASDESWYLKEKKSKDPGPSQLIYENRRDGMNPGLIRIQGKESSSWSATRLMLEKVGYSGPLNILLYFGSLLLSILLAVRLTISLSKRIFLVHLYDAKNWEEIRDNEANILFRQSLSPKLKRVLYYQYQKNLAIFNKMPFQMAAAQPNPFYLSLREINSYENEFTNTLSERRIIWMSKLLLPTYDKIWDSLAAREKFILYDFAVDGFANYKTEKIIRGLLEKGILYFNDRRLSIVTTSLREYILEKKGDEQVKTYMKRADAEDNWKHLKIPLFLILAGIGIFVFVTQDAIYQKITGLLTSVTSLLPLVSSIFSKSNGKSGD